MIVRSALAASQHTGDFLGGVLLTDEVVEIFADAMLKSEERLIAQVHSHPFEAFHSEIDNQFPLVHRRGFLSIVIPYLGKYGFEDFETYGVFEYLRNNKWRKLSSNTIKRRFELER